MRNLITDDAPPTVELRQHEATLDVVEIAAWTSLVCGLVTRCHKLVHADLVSLLSQGISQNPLILVKLLTELNLGEVARYYAEDLARAPRTRWTFQL